MNQAFLLRHPRFSFAWLAGFVLFAAMLLGLLGATAEPAMAESCLASACHGGLVRQATVHAPVKDEECFACHEQLTDQHPTAGKDDFTLVGEGADLCYQCHDRMDQGEFIHDPVEEGDCLACHRPHGSEQKALLDVGTNQQPLCFECHEPDAFAQEYIHGPVGMGACTVCHQPHVSKYKGLMKNKPEDLCLGCHTDLAQGLMEAPVVHPPVKKQACTLCHMSHSSSIPSLLRQTGEKLCFTCHDKIARKFKRSRVRHNALYIEKRCANCHETHFSEHDNLLFSDEQDVCLSCHGQDDHSRSNPLRNIKKELENKKYLHGPVAEGQCSYCHDPHGASYQRLLRGPYPGTFYAAYRPGIYGFCFECHDDVMLNRPDTEEDTRFRNGRDNLHYLHVVKAKKGRSCQACHEPHASNGSKLISQAGAPFGAWRVPIRFKLTDNGGSCAPGCHRQMLYDRVNPANNAQEDKE